VAPFAAYLFLTQVLSRFPDRYPAGYAGVVMVTFLVLWVLLPRQTVLLPHRRVGEAIVLGAFGIALWIALCSLQFEAKIAGALPEFLRPASRPGFDPFSGISDPILRSGFVAIRLLGLTVVVPLAEELFWRGFLIRWLNTPDWQVEPIGRFKVKSFVTSTLLFTLAHPEWLAAAAYAGLLNAYLLKRRDLFGCVVAHATSNLVLGVYVLGTGRWELW
jgi:hypothetical protein